MKVRFNLGRGKNYRKWKVANNNNVVVYLDELEDIVLIDTTLHNNKNTALKILKGANKSVCAWINCSEASIGVYESNNDFGLEQIFYNPKKCASWVDGHGNNLDGMSFPTIVITEGKVYKIIE